MGSEGHSESPSGAKVPEKMCVCGGGGSEVGGEGRGTAITLSPQLTYFLFILAWRDHKPRSAVWCFTGFFISYTVFVLTG